MSEIRNGRQRTAVPAVDPVMVQLLDLHSQGFGLSEACQEAEVDEGYWTRHRVTFLASLGATNVAHAVRRAIERRLMVAA